MKLLIAFIIALPDIIYRIIVIAAAILIILDHISCADQSQPISFKQSCSGVIIADYDHLGKGRNYNYELQSTKIVDKSTQIVLRQVDSPSFTYTIWLPKSTSGGAYYSPDVSEPIWIIFRDQFSPQSGSMQYYSLGGELTITMQWINFATEGDVIPAIRLEDGEIRCSNI